MSVSELTAKITELESKLQATKDKLNELKAKLPTVRDVRFTIIMEIGDKRDDAIRRLHTLIADKSIPDSVVRPIIAVPMVVRVFKAILAECDDTEMLDLASHAIAWIADGTIADAQLLIDEDVTTDMVALLSNTDVNLIANAADFVGRMLQSTTDHAWAMIRAGALSLLCILAETVADTGAAHSVYYSLCWFCHTASDPAMLRFARQCNIHRVLGIVLTDTSRSIDEDARKDIEESIAILENIDGHSDSDDSDSDDDVNDIHQKVPRTNQA